MAATYTLVPASGIGAAIVSLNANPSVRKTAGQGGRSILYSDEGFGVAPINFATTDFLPLVRVPTLAIIKKVELMADTWPSTSLEIDIGITFSNGGSGALVGASPASGFMDGTQPSNMSEYSTTAQTSIISSVVSFSFFAYNYSLSTSLPANGIVDLTFQNGIAGGNSATDGFYVPSASNQPLWQALSVGGIGGLGKATAGPTSGTVGNAFATCQTDPGGFFDICIASSVTGVNTAAVNLGLRVTYTVAAQ